MARTNRRFTDEDRKRILADWEASGLSEYAYAKRNGYAPGQLLRWKALVLEPRRTYGRFTEEDHRRILADWKASGLSQAAYARQHGFNDSQLSRWKVRYYGVQSSTPGTPSTPSTNGRSGDSPTFLDYINGLRAEIKVAEETIRKLERLQELWLTGGWSGLRNEGE